MTRMRELDREILEPHSGWGRSAREPLRTGPSAVTGGDWAADRGTGVSPRSPPAGTMSTAPTPDRQRSAVGRTGKNTFRTRRGRHHEASGRAAAELGWVER